MSNVESPLAPSAPKTRKPRQRRKAAARPRQARRPRGKAAKPSRQDQRRIVLAGLHLGDSRTRVAASENGERLRLDRDLFTNVVGVLRLKAPLGRLGGKAGVLYAEQATSFLEQLELRKPIVSGLVTDVRVCRQFLTHISSAIDPAGTHRLWGVASIPAVAGPEELDRAYRSLKGPFERVVVVPEPYLAAEGMRLEKAVQLERFGQDLTRASLVIDVGSSTTTLCLLRGGFPGPEDQVRLDVAGNSIDERIFTNALVHAPSLFLSRRMAREIKEEQAFVGEGVAGKTRDAFDLIAITDVIRKACAALLDAVVEASCSLLGRCEPAVAAALSRSVILTGGGSRIRNLSSALEAGLRSRGFAESRVLVPAEPESLVARGALRFAQKLGEEEWQALAARSPTEIARLFSGQPVTPAEGEGASEIASLARLDVGLRSEAPASAAPASPAAVAAPGLTPATRKPRGRPEETEGVDLEELDFFQAR